MEKHHKKRLNMSIKKKQIIQESTIRAKRH